MRDAAARIGSIAPIHRRSHVWETKPVGGPEQPDYLNAALLVEWARMPFELLDALMMIEADLGRVRDIPNGPRTIDLDILWIEGVVINEPRLVVPHPRLHQRAFALAPMLEVVPEAIDPRTNTKYTIPDDPGVRGIRQAL